MSKRYVSYRSDLANKAAWDAEIAAALASYANNILNYPVGKMVVTANGNLNIVSVNDGATTVTTIAVGAQIA